MNKVIRPSLHYCVFNTVLKDLELVVFLIGPLTLSDLTLPHLIVKYLMICFKNDKGKPFPL